METHLTSCGDLRLFITGILEVEGGELIVSSALSTLELELLGRGILLVCVGILYVLLLISDLYLVGLAPCHFEDFLKKIMFEVGKFSLQLERSGDWGEAGRAYKCCLADSRDVTVSSPGQQVHSTHQPLPDSEAELWETAQQETDYCLLQGRDGIYWSVTCWHFRLTSEPKTQGYKAW